jgi:hypothetical protein
VVFKDAAEDLSVSYVQAKNHPDPPQKPCAASGGAGQTLPKTAKWRLFQLIFNWRRRAI